MPFDRFFFGKGSPTKIDYRQKGTLILTSLLEDLDGSTGNGCVFFGGPLQNGFRSSGFLLATKARYPRKEKGTPKWKDTNFHGPYYLKGKGRLCKRKFKS